MLIKKTISLLYIVSFIAYGHGFGANTLIQLGDGSQATIHAICLHTLHNTISVTSYDIHNSYNTNQLVVMGKKSKINCYIRLGFDNDFDHSDIICTPSQEFYIPITRKWVPAYMLKPGDALLTKDTTTQQLKYKKFVPRSLKVYMLEIQESHTFFVGKYAILTHNIFLPVGAALGFSIPFGSIATGTAGSFFGPIGLVGGIILGGVTSIVIKALYENRIHKYKTPKYNIDYINNYCSTIIHHNDATHRPQSDGCFIPEVATELPAAHIIPIEYPSIQVPVGCIEIEINVLDNNNYDKNPESQNIISQGCFQPTEQNEQSLFYYQEKPSVTEKPNPDNKRLTARNWKEFGENTPIGQKHGEKFIHTGKCNPKDGSPIRKLIADIPNTEMFKKGRFFALDKFHEGDHFEVWQNRKWIGVANLDGSKNEKKTDAVTDRHQRRLPN